MGERKGLFPEPVSALEAAARAFIGLNAFLLVIAVGLRIVMLNVVLPAEDPTAPAVLNVASMVFVSAPCLMAIFWGWLIQSERVKAQRT